ncbi:MAG: hypothetical protein KIT80_12955 [Chitinophagaceae bacterium]|nr:hypothetical protein [Chitinophagaceae bacterium]MCW5927815.1 hypothetical protein [Chitinophagaceae bacterium]
MKVLSKICFMWVMVVPFGYASAQFFTNPIHPEAPGQRKLQIIIDLKNVPVSQFSAYIVYGTDSLAVANAFDLIKKDPTKYYVTNATLNGISGGKAEAAAILPHSGRPPVNKKEKMFSRGTKLYYAWARSNIPAGFTEELTLNSPVYSFIVPRPLTIAYLGDSFASGEGGKGSGAWMHVPCHRSANSGGELAINKLKAERKEFEIDYINTTCSGARLLDYFAVAQKADPGKTAIKQGIQVDLVTNWLNAKNYDGIDILLADGGGNDIGFGNIVEGGLLSFFHDLTLNKELREDVQRELDRLPETFNLFKNYVESKTTVGRYIWFNYPNPMTGNPLGNGGYDTQLCKQNYLRVVNPLDCWGQLENNVEDNEWKYVHDHVFKKLNQRIAEAAAAHGWDLVDVSGKALGKGVCNCNGYFNTVGQSVLSQGDVNGTMHPNVTGFREIYRDPLYNQLVTSISLFHTAYDKDAVTRIQKTALTKSRANAIMNVSRAKLSLLVVEQNKFWLKMKEERKPVDTKQIKKIK